ncbi:CHASE domain-containing protein [Roseibium aestuarii]|uniref:histidine kinase n=1 Tax=Roseibium aestuarii TaxID=2600299 RepID=A0ABW4JU26_9HYPH|nr:CHASE domain-containing protein [Roseibium aestuarii]
MYRLITPLVFSLVAIIGLGATLSYHENLRLAEEARFKGYAHEAALRVAARAEQHLSLLQSTKALFTAVHDQVSPEAFRSFAAGLDLNGRYRGVQGIGFARVVTPDNQAQVEAQIAETYRVDRKVWPEPVGNLRTAIVLLEPATERNIAAIGYDMATEPRRRAAMEKAVLTGEPVATAPLMLVQEITDVKQTGFLVYLPWYKSVELSALPDGEVEAPLPERKPEDDAATDGDDGLMSPLSGPDGLEIAGFIYAPFRTGDLHEAALETGPYLPIVMDTMDVSEGERLPLYRTEGFEEAEKADRIRAEIKAKVAGRDWLFTIYPTSRFSDPERYYPVYGMGVAVILLAVCAALMTHALFRAVITARALAGANRRSLEEKDLMLQEMKHRLKNAIARIGAMARQAAARSESLEDFVESFQGRLLAMANAQDMLTRSQWSKARMSDLLRAEVSQVLGDDIASDALRGPEVDVNETATQALGLVFHELATNALKYGGVTGPEGNLSVTWTFEGKGAERKLVIDWQERRERAPVPQQKRQGFGSRLIELNVNHELGGSLTRDIDESETRIRLEFPLDRLI